MTDKELRSLHLAYHHSTNIGNGALIPGTEYALRKDFSRPVQFEAEPWDDYNFVSEKRFDRSFVERVNPHDSKLVGAVFQSMDAATCTTRNAPRSPLSLWPEIKRPVVFYGISYRC